MLSSSNCWPSYPKKSKSLTSRLVLLPWFIAGQKPYLFFYYSAELDGLTYAAYFTAYSLFFQTLFFQKSSPIYSLILIK